ncbi:Qnr family pentapeptide repeat protein [Vibrio algivorus]|uniref:Qnr family pentapeptide repeat protein n=1 Tax=Vibrio algivorus TaxID=1667024 RepID=A0A557P4U4_9VIBR|nr:Qnr family pentapeptide repeat protein [Vibrio algivorus]TVO35685.1 Qnr family pentapeptide repeat protein [Vibrio algivorus]
MTESANQVYHQHDFSSQDLSYEVFKKCHFYQCDFSHSDLSDAQFIDCVFIESGDVIGCNFAYAKLNDASFKHCNLSMSNFDGASAFGVEMRHCMLKGASFVRTLFANHITHNTYFCSAYITQCDLSYSNLENQRLEKCDLFENRWRGANLQSVSFEGSDLSRGEFSSEQWSQVNWKSCNLAHVELEGLDIRTVNLKGVMICQWQQEMLLEHLGVITIPD